MTSGDDKRLPQKYLRIQSLLFILFLACIVQILLSQRSITTTTNGGGGDSLLFRYDSFIVQQQQQQTTPNSTERSLEESQINIQEIAQKWGIHSTKAIHLLQQQIIHQPSYNGPLQDFIHFHHLMKTGGTTFSILLEQTVGEQYILPGSHKSGRFNFEIAENILFENNNSNHTSMKDHYYIASFAHTALRPMVKGPNNNPSPSSLAQLFHRYHNSIHPNVTNSKQQPQRRRIRLLTMVRDPITFRASHMAMWVCGLNRAINNYNNDRTKLGLEPQCGLDLNISALIDIKLDKMRNDCEEGKGHPKNCKLLKDGYDPLEHCHSAQHLLQSEMYHTHLHNMHHEIMGQYTKNDTKFLSRMPSSKVLSSSSSSNNNKKSTKNNINRSIVVQSVVEEVEQYTIEDLGGMNPNSDDEEADFLWFGITDRMEESICLFYYTLKLIPILDKTPTERMFFCKTDSWWTEKDKLEVIQREPLDYAIFRAANAILDIRLAKMNIEIQTQLAQGETLDSMPYVAPGCYSSEIK